MLEHTPPSEHQSLLRQPEMAPPTPPGISASLTICSPSTPRWKASNAQQIWSPPPTQWFSIYPLLIRAFHNRGLLQPFLEPRYILVYDPGWIPQRVLFKTENTLFKSLGMEYPINAGDSTSFYRNETEAHPVYPSHLEQESPCPSGQRGSL